MRLANECILRMVMSKSQTTSLILSSSLSLSLFSSWWWLLVLIFCRVLFFMGRTQQLYNIWLMKKKEFLTRVCQFVFSLLSLLSVLVFGLFEFFFILPKKHRKIHIFQHTHTREKKRKEKKRRETTFLIRLFTRTSSYTHRRHLKHIKERERLSRLSS